MTSATATPVPDVTPGAGQRAGVDQHLALVVGDHRRSYAAFAQQVAGAADCGGLAAAQKAADQVQVHVPIVPGTCARGQSKHGLSRLRAAGSVRGRAICYGAVSEMSSSNHSFLASLDPTTMADWQLSAAAEPHMKRVQQLGAELGLQADEVLPFGHYVGKLDYARVLERLAARPNGKYVNVTAITPTPLGEGKTTTTMGLVEGLAAVGKRGDRRHPAAVRRSPRSTSRAPPPAAGWRSVSRSPTSAWA